MGIKEDDHVEDDHGVEETFHPSRYMDSANVGSDNNTTDYTEKDIQESVQFVNFLNFLYENDDKMFSFNNKDEKLKFLDGIKEYVDNLEQTYQDA